MPAKAVAANNRPRIPTAGSPIPLESGAARTAWLNAKPMPKAPSVRPMFDEVKLKTSTVK
ncbi:hypothetical protein D3C87_1996140 [compost metagenome]